jgi:hypothetical protein
MCIRKSTYAGEGKGIKETRVTLEMCHFISLKKTNRSICCVLYPNSQQSLN